MQADWRKVIGPRWRVWGLQGSKEIRGDTQWRGGKQVQETVSGEVNGTERETGSRNRKGKIVGTGVQIMMTKRRTVIVK